MAYNLLAQVYDDGGFSNYVTFMTPRLITRMQEDGWMGRRILDLGCGTGASTAYFVRNSIDVYAIEANAEMLKVADLRTHGIGFTELMNQDIREATFPQAVDLVYCMGNVLNELNSLKEIGTVLQKAFQSLQPQKRLIFDLLTLRGLGEYLGNKEQIIDISDMGYLTVQSQFNFEGMSLRQNFTLFRKMDDKHWLRGNAYLTLRGYPVAAVVALVEKIGFKVLHQWTVQLEDFSPSNDLDGRVIIVAEKP